MNAEGAETQRTRRFDENGTSSFSLMFGICTECVDPIPKGHVEADLRNS